jgi:histidyl-tRNA synthetase
MVFGGRKFDGLLLERIYVARQLWAAGVRAEFAAKVNPKPRQQFNASEGVPVAVMLGQDDLEAGQVRSRIRGSPFRGRILWRK